MMSLRNIRFNFALGLFIPPAFANISYKTFIIFGVLCLGAAVQAFFTYPETAGKSIEEIQLLFESGSIPAWRTKPGGSRLDAEVERVRDLQRKGSVTGIGMPEKADFTHKELVA